MGDKGAAALADSIDVLSPLTALSARCNGIGDQGAVKLAYAWRKSNLGSLCLGMFQLIRTVLGGIRIQEGTRIPIKEPLPAEQCDWRRWCSWHR